MATFRVYLTNTAQSSPTPAFDASWTSAPTRRRQAPTTPDNSAQTGVAISLPNPLVSGANYGSAQFYTAAIGSSLATALIAGGVSVKGQIQTTTDETGAHLILQMSIRVYDPVGAAVRGTVLALQNPADPAATPPYLNETVTETNRKLPSSANSLPITTSALAGCLSTDVLLIEAGFKAFSNTASAGKSAYLFVGSPTAGTDLPEEETQTSAGRGWVELDWTTGTHFGPFTGNLAMVEDIVAEWAGSAGSMLLIGVG